MKRRKTYYTFYRFILILITVVVVTVAVIVPTFNDKEYTVTITDKERVVSTNNGNITSKYLVFGEGENGESLVFRNTDEIFRGKLNSSNIQGALKEGKTYKIVVVGFRIPLLSCYENIISFEELEGGAE